MPVTLRSMSAFTEALDVAPPAHGATRSTGWPGSPWSTAQHDLAVFDAVFEAVFGDAVLPVDPHARRTAHQAERPTTSLAPDAAGDPAGGDVDRRPAVAHAAADLVGRRRGRPTSARCPSCCRARSARIADTPLEELDEAELALLGRWLEESAPRWPTRRSRAPAGPADGPPGRAARDDRRAPGAPAGSRWSCSATAPVRRPRPVMLLVRRQPVDAGATPRAYLHLMRAFARTRPGRDVRLLDLADPADPGARAPVGRGGDRAGERAGRPTGSAARTWPPASASCSASRHGNAVRGGVLVIASDGWDSDDPDELAAVMARARRRAHRVVWLNPRAAAPGLRAAGRLDGGRAAVLRRVPARRTPLRALPTSSTRSPDDRATGQLQSVTCTAGLNRPRLTPAPRTMAWVARGVVMNRSSSAAAGSLAVRGQRHRRPAALCRAGRARRASPAGPRPGRAATAKRTRQGRGRRCAWSPRGRPRRSGRCAGAARARRVVAACSGTTPVARRRPTARAPGLRAEPGRGVGAAPGQRVVRAGDGEHLVVQERLLRRGPAGGALAPGRSRRRRCGPRAARGTGDRAAR